nr:GNAT family N-acetyltransferase [Methylobrevis pamukkalensis]
MVACIGYSRPEPGVAELHKVYLDRRLRGRGLGARLYAATLEEIRRHDVTTIRLWTDTRFASGHRFYERLGFRRMPVLRCLADATDAWEFGYRLDLAPVSSSGPAMAPS